MKRQVYIDCIGEETRRLVVEDGELVEYAVSYAAQKSRVGNLYLARVQNVMTGMHAAFVDIGLNKNAFLPLGDMPSALQNVDGTATDSVSKKITLRKGQEILVQVVKEPGGDKGPRVTMHPTLAGQYVVLLPTVETVGVSRHIEDSEIRSNMEALGKTIFPSDMGIIFRTASEKIAPDVLTEEASRLALQWKSLEKASKTMIAPQLLFDASGDLLAAATRDLNADIHEGPFPAAWEAKLEKLLRPTIWLKSGGTLILHRTEALTAIDVNSGKSAGKRTLEASLVALNTEAAIEAARQIRLRDLGGIILIDFVDMDREESRAAVLNAFMQHIAGDRAKHHVYGFTQTGLLEMTRRPVHGSLSEQTEVRCSCCHGAGVVPSAEATAHAALRSIRRQREAGNTGMVSIPVSGAVAQTLRRIGIPENVCLCTDQKGDLT